MRIPFTLSLLLSAGSLFGGTAPEISTGQVTGEYRTQVYTPDSTVSSGYAHKTRRLNMNGITTSVGVRTTLSEALTLRTAVGVTSEYSEKMLKSDRFLQASLQNTIFRFQPADAKTGQQFYLSWGFSGHRLKTTEGYVSSLGILAGLGFGHFSEGFGWNLEVEQNESLQSNDLNAGETVLKSNQLSFLNCTASVSYLL